MCNFKKYIYLSYDTRFETDFQYEIACKKKNNVRLRWCLFFLFFVESNLFLEFRLFVFLFFHNLL